LRLLAFVMSVFEWRMHFLIEPQVVPARADFAPNAEVTS
jgi:hypothetical protein